MSDARGLRRARRVALVGAPAELGQRRRGLAMGPAALRAAGLATALAAAGCDVADLGDIAVPRCEGEDADVRRTGGLAFRDQVRDGCAAIAARLAALPPDVVPVVLGGDHTVAVGSVTGACRRERVGLVWVDAHPDFDTPETSLSGNLHGMALAALCGLGEPTLVDVGWPGPKVRPEDAVLIGVRSLDTDERALFRRLGGLVFTTKDVERLGVPAVARAAAARLAGRARVHVSLDADVLDPAVAPGVGTPVPGGLGLEAARDLVAALGAGVAVTSLDLVELNPLLDRDGRTAAALVAAAAALLGAA